MIRLAFLLTLLFAASCNKEKTSNSIVGKWKLVEIYNGYTMGGCFCWKDVASQDGHVVKFDLLGNYELKQPLHFSVSGCIGTYRVKNDSTLVFTEDCQPDPNREFERRYEKTVNTLIIDRKSIEGVIR